MLNIIKNQHFVIPVSEIHHELLQRMNSTQKDPSLSTSRSPTSGSGISDAENNEIRHIGGKHRRGHLRRKRSTSHKTSTDAPIEKHEPSERLVDEEKRASGRVGIPHCNNIKSI